MLPFEQELRDLLAKNDTSFEDNTTSVRLPDFQIHGKHWEFYLEIKEKRGPYNLNNWPGIRIPECFLLIVDDLSLRKLLWCAPAAGMLVRGNAPQTYYFFSILDFFEMPRVRFNRPVNLFGTQMLKGKWAVDLRDAQAATTLTGALRLARGYLDTLEASYLASPAHGAYWGEKLVLGGTLRSNDQHLRDFEATR